MKNQHNIRKLKIWSDSIELAVDLYKVSETLPKEEKFGLISQMNRWVIANKLNYINIETLELFEDRIDKLQRSMFNFSKTLELQKNN